MLKDKALIIKYFQQLLEITWKKLKKCLELLNYFCLTPPIEKKLFLQVWFNVSVNSWNLSYCSLEVFLVFHVSHTWQTMFSYYISHDGCSVYSQRTDCEYVVDQGWCLQDDRGSRYLSYLSCEALNQLRKLTANKLKGKMFLFSSTQWKNLFQFNQTQNKYFVCFLFQEKENTGKKILKENVSFSKDKFFVKILFSENVVINSNTNQRNPLSFANCLKLPQNLILSRDILFLNYKSK